ncbi:MAG: hypothetical protein DRQ88_06985 [Epsilonproteobacteria bacterium]|nr:MAG: hypothetical protein DRQ88_06985 [Campylobacterota bacterium]
MSIDLAKINLLVEKCHAELTSFSTRPDDCFSRIQVTFETLFNESDQLRLDIFKSSLVELFNCLINLDETLTRLGYTDPDLLEEAQLFISGGFQDIRTYLSDLENEPDSKTLKEKNLKKLNLLKDWVQELVNSLPPEALDQSIDSNLEKYIIFEIRGEHFALMEQKIKEIIYMPSEKMTPIDNTYFSDIITHREQKILIINRTNDLGEEFSPKNEGTKIILVATKIGILIGLEVDKILKIQELDTGIFTHVKDITGPNYNGPITFITMFEDAPLFIMNKQSDEYFQDIIPYHLLGDAR